MKWKRWALALAVVAGIGGWSGYEWFFKPDQNRNYDLEMVKKAPTVLSNQVKDKTSVVIVNFWASWCPPCIEETPSMLKYAKDHAGQVQLYLVSQDSSSKEIRDFVKAFADIYSVNMKIIWDADRKIGQNFKIHKMPETFIFNHEGHLVRQLSGSIDWTKPELHKMISEHFRN